MRGMDKEPRQGRGGRAHSDTFKGMIFRAVTFEQNLERWSKVLQAEETEQRLQG